jgi:hypothetical protein
MLTQSLELAAKRSLFKRTVLARYEGKAVIIREVDYGAEYGEVVWVRWANGRSWFKVTLSELQEF